MTDLAPQILPKEFTEAYFDELQKFRAREFGLDSIIPLEKTKEYQKCGVNFYRVYGIFSPDMVEVKSLIHGYLISDNEYQLIREGKRDERELTAWKPSDGNAVLWIASVISTSPGGVTKVLEAIISDLESHPHLSEIKTVAAFVTGAKGYMFAEACGMKRRQEVYDGNMPFFDSSFSRDTLLRASEMLSRTWNISDIKVSIEKLRELTNGTTNLRDMRFSIAE